MKEVIATVHDKHVLTQATDAARDLYAQSQFGTIVRGAVSLSFVEALYLLEEEKITVVNSQNKKITFEQLLKKASGKDKATHTRYIVYSNLRKRGYIVKTGLKYGADFRVYEKGKRIGQDHSKWIVYPVYEDEKMTWLEFAAKNRVAHSTKKKILIAIVDAEHDVTFYEAQWIRP